MATDTTRRTFLAGVVALATLGSGGLRTAASGEDGATNPHMTQTDYHNWDIPTPGASTDEWARILNRFFDGTLDASVALRGPLADRPSNAPENAVYHATDTDEFYRFDTAVGGWVAAGAHIGEARTGEGDGQPGAKAAYQSLGKAALNEQYRNTQQVVGTRHMTAHWAMAASQFQDSNFAYSNSGTTERIQLINYSFLEQPPNMVPVLRAQFSGSSDTSGKDFTVGVRLKSQPSGEWLLTFKNGSTNRTLYDEVYLHEAPNGSAARGTQTLTDTQIEVHAAIDKNPSAGTIFGSSHLALDWEVV